MPQFFLAFGLVYGLVQLYLYFGLRSLFSPGHAQIFGWVWLLLSIAIAVLPAKEIGQSFGLKESNPWLYGIGFTWLCFVFLLAFVFMLFDLTAVIGRFVGFHGLSDLLHSRQAILAAVILVGSGVVYGLHCAQQVNVVHTTIPTTKLPPDMTRFRIVQLTDLHLNPMFRGEKLAEVMMSVQDQEPDIVVVTGDTVERNMSDYDAEAAFLSQSGSRLGVFAIEGNHEHYAGLPQALDFLRRAGMVTLRNEVLDVGPITVIGETDPTVGPKTPAAPRSIDYSKLDLPKDRFVLLLKHRPDIDKTLDGIVDLQLSGHTHRGQVWPAYWVTRLVFDYLPGLSKRGNLWVYVSNGTGFWGPPVRLFAPPEISVIDLVPESAADVALEAFR